MPRKIPDNAALGLEDILALCSKSLSDLKKAMGRAEELSDLVIVLHLSHMRDGIDEIERKARDARQNVYRDS